MSLLVRLLLNQANWWKIMVWKKSNKSFPRLCLYPTPFRCKARISIKRKKDERKEGGTPRERKKRKGGRRVEGKSAKNPTTRLIELFLYPALLCSERGFSTFLYSLSQKNHPIYKLGARSNFYLHHYFLDAITSPSTYPCQSVGEWVSQ